MREEKFLNALAFLDDSMIEAVNKRREQKKKRKIYVMRILAGAACLGIVFSGIFVGYMLRLFLQDKFKYTESNRNEESYFADDWNNESAIIEKPTPTLENNEEADGYLEDSSTVVVKITNWQENGFEGTVARWDNMKIFAPGNEVVVVFDENVCTGVWNDYLERYIETDQVPSCTDFPEESVVRIRFNKYQKNTNKSVIYAKSVSPT